MMKRVCFYLFSALLIIFISSCSSTRSMKKGVSIGNLSESEYMEELISRSPGWDAITAKMSLAVDLNGKGPTKVNGTLRMKRDEVIQLSIAPFLGIEVARAEISPDGVLVMDRMNKRYVQVPFDELKNLAKADLDFHTLQALKESHIGLSGTRYGINWRYDKFRPLEQRQFPGTMTVSFEGAAKPVTAVFELSRLSTNKDWEAHTEVPGKYERIELQDLLKQLIK